MILYLSFCSSCFVFFSSLYFCLSFFFFPPVLFIMEGETGKKSKSPRYLYYFSMAGVFHTDHLSTPADWLAANVEIWCLQAIS